MAGQTVECIACGHVGTTKTKGSVLITIFLLFWGVIPGIIYEVWRRTGSKVCSACGSSNVKLYIPKPKQIPQQSNDVDQIQCPDCREYIRFDARKCKHCGTMIN
jgi:hypothetical protein